MSLWRIENVLSVNCLYTVCCVYVRKKIHIERKENAERMEKVMNFECLFQYRYDIQQAKATLFPFLKKTGKKSNKQT